MNHADACTQFSGPSYLMLIGTYIEIISTFLLVFFGIYLLVGLIIKKNSLKNTTGSTLINLVLAGFFQILWEIAYPIAIQGKTFAWLDDVGVSVGLCFTAVFACFGMMNLSLMWLDVARASKTMKKSGTNLSKKPLIVVIVISILFFIVMTLFWTILKNYMAGGLAAIAFMLSIGISYLIGARELDSVMSGASKEKKSPRLLKIINTARQMFGFVILFVISDVVYALTSNARPRNGAAAVYIHLIAILLIMGSNIIIFWYVLEYIRDTTLVKRGFKRKEGSKGGTSATSATTTTAAD